MSSDAVGDEDMHDREREERRDAKKEERFEPREEECVEQWSCKVPMREER